MGRVQEGSADYLEECMLNVLERKYTDKIMFG